MAYWLDYIRSVAGPDNPVLLVHGKWDREQHKPQLPVGLPRNEFPFLTHLEFSAEKDEGGRKLQRLLAALKKEAIAVLEQHPQAEIPVGWVELARTLRGMIPKAGMAPANKRGRTLSLKRFKILCKENGQVENWQETLKFLHRRGVVYWRPDLFRGDIILDQSWVLDAIYDLFNCLRESPNVFPRGRFTREALALSVWKGRTVTEQRTFLRMMESCGICFRVSWFNKWEYIAPELLPETMPAAPRRPALAEATVRFDFLHEGILRRFLSWLGSYARDEAIYWKYGFWFHEPASDFAVRIDTPPEAWKNGQPGAVTLRAWGNRSVQWLQPCLDALERMSPVQKPPVDRKGFDIQDSTRAFDGADMPDLVVESPSVCYTTPRDGAATQKPPDVVQFMVEIPAADHKALMALALIGDICEAENTTEVMQKRIASKIRKKPSTLSGYLNRLKEIFDRYFEKRHQLPHADLFDRDSGNPPRVKPRGKMAYQMAREYRDWRLGPPAADSDRKT